MIKLLINKERVLHQWDTENPDDFEVTPITGLEGEEDEIVIEIPKKLDKPLNDYKYINGEVVYTNNENPAEKPTGNNNLCKTAKKRKN